MKKKVLAIISGIASAASIGFIYKEIRKRKKLLSAESVNFFKKEITHRDHYSHERFLRENPLAIMLFIVLASLLMFNGGLQKYMQFFQTSVIQNRYTTKPFDGAVYPVDKVPRWTSLSAAERNYSYKQLAAANKLMSLPRYNVSDFLKGKEWHSHNERERNSYITYPVPNLGNYKLDGTENSGSHPGLDIKLPIGTPIKSISRGVVIKTASLNTGFGKHITVMHKDVPDPKNPGKKTTLYSSYAHLSKIHVSEGSQVRKGQIIGLSGDTGMSTAPHLHFQIDTEDAPFFPYWPITWNDVVSNSMSSYFEAVSNGLNRAKARKYTVHPMNLIASTIGYTPTNKASRLVANAGRTEREIATSESLESTNTNNASTVRRRTRIPRRLNSSRRFSFARTSAPVANNRIRIGSRRTTRSTNTLQASAPKSQRSSQTASAVVVNKEDKTSGLNQIKSVQVPQKEKELVLDRSSFKKYGSDSMWFEMDRSFVPGVATMVRLFANDEVLSLSGVTFRADSRDFVKIDPIEARKEAFKDDGYIDITITTTSKRPFKIIAESRKEKIESPTLLAKVFVDISAIGREKAAAEYVKNYDIMEGNSKGEFRPEAFLNRAEAVKSIIASSKLKLVSAKNNFKDVDTSDWFEKYVSTAVINGLVTGYDGNLFKPGNSVTKAEFLKMALVSKGIDPAETNRSPYKDVAADSWYERYFSFARNNGLLDKDSRGMVFPNKTITRIDAAYVLYKLHQLK